MRAELFRPDAPDETVATAVWDGRRVTIENGGEDAETLRRIFAVSPVVVDDRALRPAGASGETVVEPGDLEWFRTTAMVRGEREGLSVRFVSERPGGWDPAGAYRTLRYWVEKREAGEAAPGVSHGSGPTGGHLESDPAIQRERSP